MDENGVDIGDERITANTILNDLHGQERKAVHYENKGQMAAIGKKRAILKMGKLTMSGFPAWIMWLVVHIYYIIGFNNRLLILLKWSNSYLTNKKGARLITSRDWKFYM